jgi:chorismate-pyruvate lyase
MRFGDFLLARRLITEAALEQALALQRVYHRPIGKCAEDLGYITRRENVAILLKQLEIGKLYGEVAREMGMMNQDQIDLALQTQRKSILLLGKILVEKGALTRKEMVLALKEFVLSEHKKSL